MIHSKKINDINIKIEYIFKNFYSILNNDFKITKVRNQLLLHRHGSLPSYCLFELSDVTNEKQSEKLMWFVNFF